MANFHFKTTPISRSNGHSVTAKFAYICRDKIKDELTGKIHNYSSNKSKSDLIHTGRSFPFTIENFRKISSKEVWNKAEQAENRKDARVGREFLVALPKELTIEQNKILTQDFCNRLSKRYGTYIEFAIHDEKDGNNNIHAHILSSTRKFDITNPNLFTEKTNLELSQKKCKELGIKCTDEQITDLRKDWQNIVNNYLKKNGFDIEVSCDKKEDRQQVKKHLGKNANALEKKGIKTDKGNYNRQIDTVIELKEQIYNDGDKLAKLNSEIEELENKHIQQITPVIQTAKTIPPEIKKQHPTEISLNTQDFTYSLQQTTSPKVTDVKLETKEDNELKKQSYIDTGKIFDIARLHNDFFSKTIDGWENKNKNVCVKPDKVNIKSTFNTSDIQLAIDVAQSKYEVLNINGSESFQNSVYKELAINPKYADIKVADSTKLQKAKDSITSDDILNFHARTYPKYIEQVKQNGSIQIIGNGKREIINLNTATPQQINDAMNSVIKLSEQKKAQEELLSKPLTTERIFAYYEKINPELVAQSKKQGWVTYKIPGYTPSHTPLYATPKELIEALGHATGHKIKSVEEYRQDKLFNYYEKIDSNLINQIKKDGGIMVKKEGYVATFYQTKTNLKEVAEELARRTGKSLPQELNEQIKRAQQSMSNGISR